VLEYLSDMAIYPTDGVTRSCPSVLLKLILCQGNLRGFTSTSRYDFNTQIPESLPKALCLSVP